MEAPAIQSKTVSEHGVRPKKASDYQCLVAYEAINSRYFLDHLRVPNNTEQAMDTLKVWHGNKWTMTHSIARFLLCRRAFVGIGRLEPSPYHQSALTPDIHETQFESILRDELLTAGFRRSSSLVDEPNYIYSLMCPQQGHGSNETGPHERCAILIGHETDKQRLALFFLICASLSLIAGIGIGVKTMNIVNGAAVAGSILTFMGTVQAACFFACN